MASPQPRQTHRRKLKHRPSREGEPTATDPLGRATKVDELTAKTKKLSAEFLAAHRDGMAGLQTGDYEQMGEAIARERRIINQHKVIIERLHGRRAKA